MVIFGCVFIKRPPKSINCLYGYRTARSMKTKAAWDFAHAVCGRFWLKAGLVLLPLSVAAMLPVAKKPAGFVGIYGLVVCFVELAVLISAVFVTERALKRQFDCPAQ